ncbi:MAG: ABC transporter substrate-binding protein [Anaerolineaceae bacterium]|nr:ABC transporter substrate-binding protein [Anaerolineaceae bacterium]
MKRNTLMLLVGMVIIASMVLAACQPTPAPVVEEPVVEEPVVEEPVVEEPVVEEPTAVPTEVPTPEPVRTTRKGGWLDEIVVSVVDSGSAVTQIQAGAIDIYAAGLSSSSLPEIEAAGLDYAQSNGLYYELTFNAYGPTFDQSTGAVNPFFFAKAREALNWLVDRDYINREVYNGGALPKFWSIITNMPDYTKMAETVRRLEAKYAYNPELADAQMEEVMLGIEGVTREDGMYMFNGEQVTLIMLIRNDSDKTRIPIGDYVANQLETIGFVVDRQYKTSSEASPIWVGGNVADGLWHLYTGAWSATIIDRDEGDNFEFFDTPQSAYGFSSTWQAFQTGMDTEYGVLADKLAYNKFETIEERDAAMAQMLELALTESSHVWLIDGKNFTPYRDGVEVTYDLAAGVDGSMIWPYTIRLTDQEGGQLKWGAPDLFVDPWNPIAGSNWAFDQAIGRATWGEAYMIDPHTGLYWPQRFDRAEITIKTGLPVGKTFDWVDLSFEDEIAVPEDAIVDWDAENQTFVTAAEKFPDGTTANVKSVVYYPADLFDTVKWHDGSPVDLGDFIYSWIVVLDMGKEASPIFDESYQANSEAILANYKGFRILSENPLTIEAYTDAYQTDAELNIDTMWPSLTYGEAPWHVLAMAARADEAGEVAFSGDKADAKSTETTTVEWFSQIGGPSLEIVSTWLDTSIEEGFIPYANALAAYITPEEAVARYENAKAFFAEYGHYNIGTGPYILSEVYLTEKVGTLIPFADFPDLSDKWSQFGDPKVATIELDGEGSVVLGGEFAFDVYVTFEGEAYPADEIKEVKGLLYDATGQIVGVIDGVLVEDGYYTITVPADVSAAMEAGASKLEAVVVPLVVAIPSFVALEFVTVK